LERLGRSVVILDPAKGRRTLAWSSFAQQYAGIALTFEAGPQGPPAHRRSETWYRVIAHVSRLRECRVLAARLLVGTFVLHAFALTSPLLVAWVIDDALSAAAARGAESVGVEACLDLLALGAAALAVVLGIAGFLHLQLLASFEARGPGLLQNAAFRQAVAFPESLANLQSLDATTARLVRLASRAVARHVASLVVDGSRVFLALAALAVLDPGLAAVASVASLAHLVLLAGSRSSIGTQLRLEMASGLEPAGRAFNLLHSVMTDRDRVPWRKATLATLRTTAVVVASWLAAHRVLEGQECSGTLLAAVSLTLLAFWPVGAVLVSVRRLAGITPRIDALDMALGEEAKSPFSP
jgi:ABC-type bacteriocin/lantibiotic exporter with double-glycine peptidase domain